MRERRDEFSAATKEKIAKNVGYLCSAPHCRAMTIGANADGSDQIRVGIAAHICAAAPLGPRYDATMTREERASASNGLWLCNVHAKAIDDDPKHFAVPVLLGWKRDAEHEAFDRVLRRQPPPRFEIEKGVGLRAAAVGDLAVLRRTAKWPRTEVALNLKVDGFAEAVTTFALARAAQELDDLILVAPPGFGKTTTLLQIADGLLDNPAAIPVFISLADWATEGRRLLASILSRPSFASCSEADLRHAASNGHLILLLDGWNELEASARSRLRVEVEDLKAQSPKLALVISTRRQVLDLPFGGHRVDLLALGDNQQLEIAKSMVGEVGAALLDRAWRTAGVRDLVEIPFYLNVLLSLPVDQPFPSTREEMLRRFVVAHEAAPASAEQFATRARGFQADFLEGLADFAMVAANTVISDGDARQSISKTSLRLVGAGQIAIAPEPAAVLEVLVAHHLLVRANETPGFAFQHQQFQEWFASHDIERRMVIAVVDPFEMKRLQREVLDQPGWEESILFAVERTARGSEKEQAACAALIVAGFDVDPMLAAEMIYRSSGAVWDRVKQPIAAHIHRWHVPGACDRALRFMLNSGRPEFLDLVWPSLTDANEQISLAALRNCQSFRPSILGPNPEKLIAAIGAKQRETLLSEMVINGGADGIELATRVATQDSDVSVQTHVADSLSFRLANRHLAILLRNAPDAVLDHMVQRQIPAGLTDDETVKKRMVAAQTRIDAGLSSRQSVTSIREWSRERNF